LDYTSKLKKIWTIRFSTSILEASLNHLHGGNLQPELAADATAPSSVLMSVVDATKTMLPPTVQSPMKPAVLGNFVLRRGTQKQRTAPCRLRCAWHLLNHPNRKVPLTSTSAPTSSFPSS